MNRPELPKGTEIDYCGHRAWVVKDWGDQLEVACEGARQRWYWKFEGVECKVIKMPETECTCGNPEMGFDCVCEFVANNPGTTDYSCQWCGIYTAGKARCNECEEC